MAIFQSLHENKNLKTIIAEWNNIGDGADGIEALGKLLETNPNIQHVDL